ncbi:MAG: hypothetical protein AB7O60_08250 [Variibacter sp.]
MQFTYSTSEEFGGDDEIVLYFDIFTEGLDASTFGHALIAFEELYRAINSVINVGDEIGIEFIRSDSGSIRAVLKSFRKDSRTLIESPLALIVFPFLLNILTNIITSDGVNIVVNDTSYVVERGRERIVLPRNAEQKAKKAIDDPSVRRSVRNFFSVVELDSNVKAVDFRLPEAPDTPVIPIPRDRFAMFRDVPDVEPSTLPLQRFQPFLRQRVVVVTAVLERTKRKWRFLWNGQRIGADIIDEDFYLKLERHEYEFGQGDALIVDLMVEQELDKLVGAYENKKFHVTKVHSHSKGLKQTSLFDGP